MEVVASAFTTGSQKTPWLKSLDNSIKASVQEKLAGKIMEMEACDLQYLLDSKLDASNSRGVLKNIKVDHLVNVFQQDKPAPLSKTVAPSPTPTNRAVANVDDALAYFRARRLESEQSRKAATDALALRNAARTPLAKRPVAKTTDPADSFVSGDLHPDFMLGDDQAPALRDFTPVKKRDSIYGGPMRVQSVQKEPPTAAARELSAIPKTAQPDSRRMSMFAQHAAQTIQTTPRRVSLYTQLRPSTTSKLITSSSAAPRATNDLTNTPGRSTIRARPSPAVPLFSRDVDTNSTNRQTPVAIGANSTRLSMTSASLMGLVFKSMDPTLTTTPPVPVRTPVRPPQSNQSAVDAMDEGEEKEDEIEAWENANMAGQSPWDSNDRVTQCLDFEFDSGTGEEDKEKKIQVTVKTPVKTLRQTVDQSRETRRLTMQADRDAAAKRVELLLQSGRKAQERAHACLTKVSAAPSQLAEPEPAPHRITFHLPRSTPQKSQQLPTAAATAMPTSTPISSLTSALTALTLSSSAPSYVAPVVAPAVPRAAAVPTGPVARPAPSHNIPHKIASAHKEEVQKQVQVQVPSKATQATVKYEELQVIEVEETDEEDDDNGEDVDDVDGVDGVDLSQSVEEETAERSLVAEEEDTHPETKEKKEESKEQKRQPRKSAAKKKKTKILGTTPNRYNLRARTSEGGLRVQSFELR